MVLPACIAQICDFDLESLGKGEAFIGGIEGDLMLEVLE